MIIVFASFVISIGLFIYYWILNSIKNNSKIISFNSGMLPSKTGKYYIFLNDEILTTDFYNADKHQWVMTKNPTCISHFAEYGDK